MDLKAVEVLLAVILVRSRDGHDVCQVVCETHRFVTAPSKLLADSMSRVLMGQARE